MKTKAILLVEDDQIDQKSVKRAFKELNIGNPLDIVENGIEAIEYLNAPNKEAPCLILLDLNMPKMNGREFLEKRNANEVLKLIPVVVLTTSQEESDLFETYKLGVAGYLLKPVNYKDFVKVVQVIHAYWFLSLTPPVSKNHINSPK